MTVQPGLHRYTYRPELLVLFDDEIDQNGGRYGTVIEADTSNEYLANMWPVGHRQSWNSGASMWIPMVMEYTPTQEGDRDDDI